MRGRLHGLRQPDILFIVGINHIVLRIPVVFISRKKHQSEYRQVSQEAKSAAVDR